MSSFRKTPSGPQKSGQAKRPPSRKNQIGDDILAPMNASIRLDADQYMQKLQRFQSMKTPIKKVKDKQEDALVALLQKLKGEQLWKEISEFHRTTQVLYETSYLVHASKWDELTNVPKREYTHYRYTPIVSEDADEFTFDGYKLRYQREGLPIKMMVGITIYNEEFKELEQTILGICEAIEHMHQKGLVNWWEVVLVIVQDGVQKLHSSVPAALEQLGLFSDEVMYDKNRLGEQTTAHLFEYTTRIIKEDNTYFAPIQTCFLTKTENRGKLSSHTWVFNCFAKNLNPDNIVLFDAGTRPYPSSLSFIQKFFTRNETIGACCGELEVDRPFKNGVLSSIQYLEWKFSYIMEIPFNHLCGFLTVLPGAFSAYRWQAIQGVPLSKYFEGFYRELVMSPFYRNVYLAEDRVLCMEIVAKKECNYRLGYVKNAVARADTPTTLSALLRQRRRWLNGTFFAMLYDFMNFYRIWTQSGHNILRKFVLTFQFIYLLVVTLINSWLGIGIIFIFCFMLLYQLTPIFRDWFPFLGLVSQEIAWAMVFVYVFFLLLELITSMNNKPDYAKGWHWICSIVFLGYTCIFTAVTVWFVVQDIIQGFNKNNLREIRLSTYLLVAMTILVLVIVTLHGQLKALVFAGIPYYLFTTAYINVLQMYAFTNTHDISWGTKDLNKLSEGSHDKVGEGFLKSKADYKVRVEQRRRKQKMPTWEEAEKVILAREAVLKRFSTYFILTWVVSNLIIGFLVFYIADLTSTVVGSPNYYNIYIEIIFYGVSVLRIFQVIASFWFISMHYLGKLGRRKFKVTYGPVTEHTLNPDFVLKAKGALPSDAGDGVGGRPTNGRGGGGMDGIQEDSAQRANSNQPLLIARNSQEGQDIEMTATNGNDRVGGRKESGDKLTGRKSSGESQGMFGISPAQKHMVNKVEKARQQDKEDTQYPLQDLSKGNRQQAAPGQQQNQRGKFKYQQYQPTSFNDRGASLQEGQIYRIQLDRQNKKGQYLNQGLIDTSPPIVANPQASIEEIGPPQTQKLNVTGADYDTPQNLNVTGINGRSYRYSDPGSTYNNQPGGGLNITGTNYQSGGGNLTVTGGSQGGGYPNHPPYMQQYNSMQSDVSSSYPTGILPMGRQSNNNNNNNQGNNQRPSIPLPQEAVSYNNEPASYNKQSSQVFSPGKSQSSIVDEEDFEQRYMTIGKTSINHSQSDDKEFLDRYHRIKQQQQNQRSMNNRSYNQQPSYLSQQTSGFNSNDNMNITPQSTSSFKRPPYNVTDSRQDQSSSFNSTQGDQYQNSPIDNKKGGRYSGNDRYQSNTSQLSDISEYQFDKV